jgi:phosphoglycerate dehydrogenase-like enzyme
MKILFCGVEFPEAPRTLERCLDPRDELVVVPAERVQDSLADVDVLIPAMVRITPDHLAAPHLKLVQQFATGVEGIDLVAARSRGIPVANIPTADSGNAKAVAEVAILHLLSLMRRYQEAEQAARQGQLGIPMGHSLVGKQVVVLGLGAVADELLQRLAPFEVDLRVVSRRSADDAKEALRTYPGAKYFSLDELTEAMDGADALVVCIRQVAGASPLIGASELASMTRGAVVVNVARGSLIDRAALEDALASGQVGGLGLDVYWTEPPEPTDPIFVHNTSLTPHIGGVSVESYELMAAVVVDNIDRLRSGRQLRNLVN